ncbi:hypothetical protein GUJ93_ZPchr0010g10858 [Zizania palustris]|uniref:CCHC-type domain-containing protein n=1 Tax=Zizania palustris TaxID=103762 RepID=A0A8J5WD84_ZIZPA|nr:hypothetical protein GUJ93_ZPchr0010g10858 [Zizania palustris]
MYQFCHGLRSDFESIRMQQLSNPVTPSIADVLSALIAEETRLHSLASAPISVPHSVLAASQRSSLATGGSSEGTLCDHCKKTGHCSENCFVRYPEKLAEYRAHRARGRSTSKGYVSIVAASSISAAQSSWVLDSGASFHVTSDQS